MFNHENRINAVRPIRASKIVNASEIQNLVWWTCKNRHTELKSKRKTYLLKWNRTTKTEIKTVAMFWLIFNWNQIRKFTMRRYRAIVFYKLIFFSLLFWVDRLTKTKRPTNHDLITARSTYRNVQRARFDKLRYRIVTALAFSMAFPKPCKTKAKYNDQLSILRWIFCASRDLMNELGLGVCVFFLLRFWFDRKGQLKRWFSLPIIMQICMCKYYTPRIIQL